MSFPIHNNLETNITNAELINKAKLIISGDIADNTLARTHADVVKGSSQFFNSELFNSGKETFFAANLKKLTGTFVSSDPKKAAHAVLYYKNPAKRVYSAPRIGEKYSQIILGLGTVLLSVMPGVSLYEWDHDMIAGTNISFPISTAVEEFLSELGYLLRLYDDISYGESQITRFSILTRYIFGILFAELEREHAPKHYAPTPELYKGLEKGTGISARSTTIKGLIWLMTILYEALKCREHDKIKPIWALRASNISNLAKIRKKVRDFRDIRISLLHEWAIVCTNSELNHMFSGKFPELLREQRKAISGRRGGKDTIKELKTLEDIIHKETDSVAPIVYKRQKKLHAFNKTRRENAPKVKGSDDKVEIPPVTRLSWRQHCASQKDFYSLSEISIPLLRAGLISEETQLCFSYQRSFIDKGECTVYYDASIRNELWFIALKAELFSSADITPERGNELQKIYSNIESRIHKTA